MDKIDLYEWVKRRKLFLWFQFMSFKIQKKLSVDCGIEAAILIM